MLPSQRALFDMPREICYLNAASWSPLPLATQEAGRIGVARKGQPWTLDPGLANKQHERARKAAAALINAEPEDVALISSVGYGVATAGKILDVPRGSRVLLIHEDHSSPTLEWMARAEEEGFTVETVQRPDDNDWTAALLAAIERPGPPVGLASISSVHWSDGGAVDLDRVAAALRKQGAALLVDATHGAGIMKLDVKTLDPDFLVFPTYKWVLGPYGRAFLYVAKRHQDGVPLEQTAFGRRAVAAERQPPYLGDLAYVSGARRFDMGERDHFISMEMAAIGMEMMAGWGSEAVVARLRMLTDLIAEGLRNSGVLIADPKVRVPHVLSLTFPKGMPDKLIERLAASHIYVAPRLGRVRISPHVYNDETDVQRFVDGFRKLMA
jgi:selenocysteine lyase/cysteine desulfurase